MATEESPEKASDLAPSLMEVVADSGAAEQLLEVGQMGVAQLMDSDALHGIPLVGPVLSLTKAGFGIREYLFLRKLARFIGELGGVDTQTRADFAQRVSSEPEFCKSVGEKLLLLLERSDDMEKPALIGRAFAAFLEGAVDLEQFLRMADGIDRALVVDLRRLSEAEYNPIEAPWGANLLPSGLVVQHVSQAMVIGGTSYPLTEAGILVKQHCFL